MSADTPPILSAIAVSSKPSSAMKSLSSMAELLPTGRARTPAHVAPRFLADAMAVMLVDLVGELPMKDRTATLERLANRFHARASTPNGSDAARLLGGVGAALMEMGL